MAALGRVNWIGKSGEAYMYEVFSIGVEVKPNQDGNYIYCRIDDGRLWVPIYIGEGVLEDRAKVDNHHQGECIKRRGATHFHAHRNPQEENRKYEESDLLANYPVAYKPMGCNEKEGG